MSNRRGLGASLFAVTFAGSMFMAPRAFAQEPAPAAPPADGAAAAPAPGAPAAAPAAEEEEGKARFRWGISALGGPYFYDGASGGLGGVDARIGWQLNNDLAIYGQPIVLIGGGASTGPSSASVSAMAFGGVGALVDYTVGDLLYLAIGPEIMLGSTGSASAGVGTASAAAASGTFVSVAARVGLALGSKRPDRRKAFIIGLDAHSVFVSGGPLIVPALALGYEAF